MATSNRVERFKYGICLNDECPKCKSKEIQQVPMRKDLVCSECGKELRECPAPKKGNKMPIYIAAAVVLLAIIIGCVVAFSGGSGEPKQVDPDPVGVGGGTTDSGQNPGGTTDSGQNSGGTTGPGQNPGGTTDSGQNSGGTTDSGQKSGGTTDSGQKSGGTTDSGQNSGGKTDSKTTSVNLGYAKYTGPVKNGKPNGMGRMNFTSSHIIDSRDPKGRTAEAGDYVIGEWKDGKLIQGRWYDSSNNVKEGLYIGM